MCVCVCVRVFLSLTHTHVSYNHPEKYLVSFLLSDRLNPHTPTKNILLHCLLRSTRLCVALQRKSTYHSWFIGPQELAVSVVQIAHVNLTCKDNYTCFLMSMTVACASSTWIVYGQSQGNDLAQIITHARHISLRCTMSSDTTIFAHRIVSPLSPRILLSPVHS